MRNVAELFIAGTILLTAVQTAKSQVQQPPALAVSQTISAHYLAVAESAAAAPAQRPIWQRRLDGARDTLENVLVWNNSHQQSDASLRMLVALNRFWNGTSVVAAFEQAFDAPGEKDAVIRARAFNSASAAAFRIKDQERTRRWARQSIAMFSTLHDSSATGRAYQRLVQAALRDGDHASLRALADTGQALCVHDEDCRAYLVNMRGESARVLRQYDSAAIYYATADSMYRRVSPVFRVDIAHNIGFALLALGRSNDAKLHFREGLQHALANGDKPNTAFLLAGMASAEAADKNAVMAAKLFGLSDAMLGQTGRVADPADAVEYERYRSRARDQLGVSAFNDSVSVGRRLSADSVLVTLR
ncbi:MAG: hypothetical protein QOF66_7700 [Mycobacterium sp.]|uniref:hypothetical protein n=1 Tax=Mycobacterium sp. TaxID=1785 RepID=UPI0028BAC1EC|nr:hypothetical protein [Mycobacterium sp.]